MGSPEGVRRTKQREAILEVLRSTDTHPDAQWVHAQVRGILPRISLGTVYRNLDLLARGGLIREFKHAGSFARYDGNTSRHGHVTCRSCGCMRDVVLPPGMEIPLDAVREDGFEEVSWEVGFSGVCADCQRQSDSAI